MIQFNRLRLNGFKSFVDKTELEIAPGLNGIVGPNGCGKSNLVEALRWVMGENSAKRMRGGGMEDVIFNGTDTRSARNIAEVSLLLDNGKRAAPAAYNGNDEIEVVRRIERDHGSNYKINGKNVRARDVQMLFADTVTGANSPALVSQGKVTQIINSKPLERRLILEESAGISGLYARRHEAELRLKAADGNLVRIDDVLGSMEERLNGLKRQARQATRYKNLNTQIRQLEILVAWLEWTTIQERSEKTRQTFEAAETTVAEKLAAVTQLTKTHTTQSQDLPALRKVEAESAAALQLQKITLQRIEEEAQRLQQSIAETRQQIEQSEKDHTHESQTAEESAAKVETLDSEQKKLLTAQENDHGALDTKQKAKEELEVKVAALEEQYTALMQSAAESKARKQALEQQIRQNNDRMVVVSERKEKAEKELEPLQDQDDNANKIRQTSASIEKLESEVAKLSTAMQEVDPALAKIKEKIAQNRTEQSQAEAKSSELNAEIAMLESLLADDTKGGFALVLDNVKAAQGFEKALSRALGDALLASLDSSAPVYWRKSASAALPALPSGVKPLAEHVKAPEEMRAALALIGLVENFEEGESAFEKLAPGQSLVSADGHYWRWDGLCKKADASDSNAIRLEQKNKLESLARKKPEIESTLEKTRQALAKSIADQDEFEKNRQTLQNSLREAEEKLTSAKLETSSLRESQARIDSERSRLNEIIRIADEDLQTLKEVTRWDQERLATYEKDSSDKETQDTEKLRQSLLDARDAHQAAVRAFDIYKQEQSSRKARLHAIADDRINMQNRLIRARERMKELENRQTVLKARLDDLQSAPKNSKNDKEKLLSLISELEMARDQAAENLAARENEVNETSKALKEAEASLSEARESRAHAQATLSGLQEQRDAMEASIREQFDMKPAELPDHAAINMDKFTGDLESLRAQKEKLVRERENIGPVNLRADDEAVELEKQVTTLLHERGDLVSAIDELRGGINKINKEARERLLGAFDHVNAHFQQLFTRLFAGGKAHLALIDSDDPLGAGLEIFAQPPGKTLQSLSLLSGGEQTLASIALIFAMFLTNPSPICVLDEIDAPLDDANVERVCDLLDDIAARGQTRFLIITHHRMTMARMDRLYGVTMSERGISQLVSVDLQQSFEFLEAA